MSVILFFYVLVSIDPLFQFFWNKSSLISLELSIESSNFVHFISVRQVSNVNNDFHLKLQDFWYYRGHVLQ